MKKTLYAFAIILFWLPAFSQEKKLDDILKDANIPGIQLLYTKNNKVQVYNLGVTAQGSTQKVTSNTIFEAASLSKSVFAYAVLKLNDRSIISLDTPLLHYIGTYQRFDPKDPRYAKITARMVLRHTTGLPNWGDDAGVKLIFPPDSTFSYSGEGYLFLQRVMEKRLNKSLNDIMQEEVFTPLKMENSSYVWIDKFDTVSAFGNSEEAKNRHKNQNAASSLLTNANDYTTFLKALIAGKGLKPETHKMMFEKASTGNWFHHDIKEANQHINWGLGLGLFENEKGKVIWHWGDNGDFKCFYLAYPDRNEIFIYFTHSNNGLNITGDVLDLFLGKQTWWPVKWLNYGYKSPVEIKALRAKLDKQGYEHAIELVNELRRKDPSYELPENDLNELGFLLMQQDKKKDAAEIFKLNINLYPNSGNAYDSLAEDYEAMGENALAIKNFKRSVELNPKNTYRAEHIKKLESIK
jgi:CubicO group peptidase (beta-lactamase class C family)